MVNKTSGVNIMKNNRMKCACGAMAYPTTTRIEGFIVKAWKCKKCHEEYLDSGDAEFVLLAKKMQKNPISAKVGILGNNYILRIPKEIAEILHLTRGKTAKLKLNAPDKLEVSVS